MNKKHGIEIIASSSYGDLTFESKWEACRQLGLDQRKLNRLIDKDLPVKIDGIEYWLDELEDTCR